MEGRAFLQVVMILYVLNHHSSGFGYLYRKIHRSNCIRGGQPFPAVCFRLWFQQTINQNYLEKKMFPLFCSCGQVLFDLGPFSPEQRSAAST